eukprot:14153859-Alexandrium_andersonii.AAC.1
MGRGTDPRATARDRAGTAPRDAWASTRERACTAQGRCVLALCTGPRLDPAAISEFTTCLPISSI